MQSNLKKLMKEKGTTILGLADETGLSSRTIQRARDERIELCTLKTLAVIAEALGVGVKQLFDEARP
ncbi:helix-turn-helix transcriptional regulator [Pseudodesulfovibrio sp.]|uniref:helix-turn-helix domain-containing protein n=1 Tax=Pseudodesulfovibrio sp. TaxID=2035812 RepID=UPI00261C430B|nr:helix-turn-helix transcriptional regulator [Pseudodesulfovibrio sp.]MDD3313177.1 helix-turn-helix transcriptional regulator [Pseudodesulfovibrio sp.]